MQIDLYTEITCPWCIVGHHRLDKVLTERFPNLIVDIRQHPVLLLPDAPSGGLYIPDLLRSRYGITDPKVAFARPEGEARASGFDLDLGRQLWAYPTQAAHAVILAAAGRDTQHRLAVAITDAYFIAAKNIADADVLADIAADYGFNRDQARAIALDPEQHHRVEAEAFKSANAGVRSVPHFVFGESIAINGGRCEDEIAAAIQAASGAIPL
ncbi:MULTISPECIES: DsbA family protein [Burkholderia]|uniref:DsbA family protein n=1 Tax=Burkholderia TaxID=32008 RepID=UPI001CF14D79|nr:MULTISPECIES: DsbA family protein [Burkholderia]MCA8104009.1 DsbA family protein [Burkholderia sp. AU36459]MDF3091765.1 DsbA family protein [Burkholderia semiarida]MDF3107276.1 DsbA family protein [Burkholderia semiarida]MDF3116008.1 DsbA family protein [Burkholderia semiarida]